MELFLLYTLLKLDTVINVLIGMLFLVGILSFIFTVPYYVEGEHKKENPEYDQWRYKNGKAGPRPPEFLYKHIWEYSIAKKMIAFAISLLVLVTFLPSTKQVALLAVAHYSIQTIFTQEGQKILTLLRKKANAYLDEQLRD